MRMSVVLMMIMLMIRWCWYKDNVDTMMMQSFYDDDDTTTFDQSIWGQTWHSKAFVFQRMSRRHWHVVPARDGSAAFQIGWIFWESRGGKLAKRTDVPILCLFSSDLRPICKFSDKRSVWQVFIFWPLVSVVAAVVVDTATVELFPGRTWGGCLIQMFEASFSWSNPNLGTIRTCRPSWHPLPGTLHWSRIELPRSSWG